MKLKKDIKSTILGEELGEWDRLFISSSEGRDQITPVALVTNGCFREIEKAGFHGRPSTAFQYKPTSAVEAVAEIFFYPIPDADYTLWIAPAGKLREVKEP